MNGIKEKMKECRRTPRSMTRVVEKPQVLLAKKEPVPSSEDDDTTLARHMSLMKIEYKKKHPNKQIIKELMDKTYKSRRTVIGTQEVKETITQYPCLTDYDEV